MIQRPHHIFTIENCIFIFFFHKFTGKKGKFRHQVRDFRAKFQPIFYFQWWKYEKDNIQPTAYTTIFWHFPLWLSKNIYIVCVAKPCIKIAMASQNCIPLKSWDYFCMEALKGHLKFAKQSPNLPIWIDVFPN